MPHQFLLKWLPFIKGNIRSDIKALSAIKGVDFINGNLQSVSTLINNELNVDVSILMGSNIANDMGKDKFCETTIG